MSSGNGTSTSLPVLNSSLRDVVAQELAAFFDWNAGNFPIYRDPVVDELDADCYRRIRTCIATAFPIKKLALRLSTFQLRVVGDSKRAEQVQQIIDAIPHLGPSIKALVWGNVEGVIFGWLTAENNGKWFVPTIDVRQKAKAGGILEWDGTCVVQRARTSSTESDPKVIAAQKLPRNRVVVYRPSFSANPEGDTDIAWMLFRLAEVYEEISKNMAYYTKRYGAPWEIFKKSMDKANAAAARSAANTAAEKMAALPHQGLTMSAADTLGLVEPSGSTWGFLIQYEALCRKLTHQLILQNSLTSDTSDTGPAGSSSVHADEEDQAVQSVADSLSEALTQDLLPFIELQNEILLDEPQERLRLELQIPPPAKPDPTPYEALAFFHSGIEVDSAWLYSALGAPKPASVPETIRYVAPDPTAGGRANEMPDLPADAKAYLAAINTRPAMVKLAAAKEEPADPREAFVQMNVSEFAYDIEQMLEGLVKGYSPEYSEALIYSLQRVGEQAHQHGQISLQLEVRKLPVAGQKLSAKGERLVQLRDAASIALGDRYREMAQRSSVAATAYLREAIHKKLVDFIKAGGQPNDAKKFVDWMLKQQPNFTKNYAELVLRNAVNTAYSAGRLEEYRQTAPLLGLNWQYLTAGDERVRPLHAEYHMLVFPPGPEWERFMPPNGHNCRCTWIVVDGTDMLPSEGLSKLPAPEWNYAPDAGPF